MGPGMGASATGEGAGMGTSAKTAAIVCSTNTVRIESSAVVSLTGGHHPYMQTLRPIDNAP